MRVVAAAALFTLIPVLASAQSQGATLPPIGLPLPEIGLPLPPLGLAPPGGPTPVERAARGGPRRDRTAGLPPHRGRAGQGRSGSGVIYLVPAYPWMAEPGAPTPGMIVAPPPETPDAPATPPSETQRPEQTITAASPEPSPSAARVDAPTAPPIPRKPFYFIQGCYLGDVPPADAKLPASCDPAKATIFWP